MPHLRITAQDYSDTYALPSNAYAEVVVGTAPYCQLSLSWVKGLAEVHACIVREQRGYVMTDMNAPGSTLADGKLLQGPALMKPGVVYSMGELSVELVEDTAPEPPEKTPEPPQEPPQATRPQPEIIPIFVPVPQPIVQPQPIVPQPPPQQKAMPAAQPQRPAPPRRKSKNKARKRTQEMMSTYMSGVYRREYRRFLLHRMLWSAISIFVTLLLIYYSLSPEYKEKIGSFFSL